MLVFDAKYLSDEDIWAIIEQIYTERAEVEKLLGQPEISTDPQRMPELAKQLFQLNEKCLLFDHLKRVVQDLREMIELLSQDGLDVEKLEPQELMEKHELAGLYLELLAEKQATARQVYNLLISMGLMDIEIEDDKDIEILQFIDYAGPEYAWRLGINVGLDVEESRKRLEKLLAKGLLERVPGNMLEGYHRQKDWVKHMNHTYYRITREGRHYLRKLRTGLEDLSQGEGRGI
ncbi:DUF2250 domain-containing protein [Desulforamulus ferrireducens]|nr:DUF2250 domain-containing protein [Desulforamulus ferrireducens]